MPVTMRIHVKVLTKHNYLASLIFVSSIYDEYMYMKWPKSVNSLRKEVD